MNPGVNSKVPQFSGIGTEQPGFVGCLVQSFPLPGSPKLSRGVRNRQIDANDDAHLSMAFSGNGPATSTSKL